MIDLRPLAAGRTERPPDDPGRAVEPVAGQTHADHVDARHRCGGRLPDDDRDVVADVGQTFALTVEDAVVTDWVN